MINKTRNTVKKYRQGNIPAAFGADLWLSGATNVPNMLLKFYKEMNLTDSEVMTLIQMFRLRNEEKDLHPAPEALAEYMSAGPEEIERNIKSLFEKKILVETLYYDETRDDVITGYDFEPLFEKLSDYWACARAKEIEKAGTKLDGVTSRAVRKEALASCYRIFENEFGRPLSPIEVEKIAQWVEYPGPELVQEALRRAVLLGKRNFRYIDTILLEWTKNNLDSIASIEEYDRKYQAKRSVRGNRGRSGSGLEDASGAESNKRKALIKKLYLT
ncbi:MAG: DnaD domain protein [Peptococcaceae bacterium]|nr:DnaD domain protein [Peptococcaceae bacterium]